MAPKLQRLWLELEMPALDQRLVELKVKAIEHRARTLSMTLNGWGVIAVADEDEDDDDE